MRLCLTAKTIPHLLCNVAYRLMQGANESTGSPAEDHTRCADWLHQLLLWGWQVWRSHLVRGWLELCSSDRSKCYPNALHRTASLLQSYGSGTLLACYHTVWPRQHGLMCMQCMQYCAESVCLACDLTAGGTRRWTMSRQLQQSTLRSGARERRQHSPPARGQGQMMKMSWMRM